MNMSTTISPELSKRNKYWINRHRYYELKHFCLQYPIWEKAYALLNGMSKKPVDQAVGTESRGHGDPTAKCAIEKGYYLERMRMLEKVACETDRGLACYILKGVTEGISYDHLKTRWNIPFCKETYYNLYRKFFWLLDQERQ